MKKVLLSLLLSLSVSIAVLSQVQYEVSRDPQNGNKVLKGFISRNEITSDTAFLPWYTENQKGYTPNAGALDALKKHTNTVQFVVFSGTWCSDSKVVIPKFYALMDAAGFPENRVTLIGTDRNKKTLSHLAEALNIVSVPTIIVMKDGKEIGRVVEYGKYGLYDMELAEILKSIPVAVAGN
jgi:thiol-disulfide isomerase/thioredoxin